MTNSPPRVQLVAPAFNEAVVLPEFIQGFLALRSATAASMALRLLVVDDGSNDRTIEVLRSAALAHPDCIAYLSFTANAGHQAALIAGLLNAGRWPDAIVTLDADLEHPFTIVPMLVEAWQRTGAIVVHGIRRESRGLNWRKRWASAWFYRITARLTGLALQPGQADFRLWDADAVRRVADYLPHIGSLRVFAAWMPGRKESVEYDQALRADRSSRFTLRKNYELAAISIIRFSHFPLRAITGIGILGLVFAFVYGIFITIESIKGNTIPGWSSTVLTVMTMGCLQLVSIGILASYLRRLVFARDLPLYIISEARLPDAVAERTPR
jgi:polyisoprenyl-phosphate glycosyltransferase